MAEGRKIDLLKTAWSEGGLKGVFGLVAEYAQWKIHGSPIDASVSREPAEEWLDRYGDVRPMPQDTSPDTRFSIICPVYDTPTELLRECVESVVSQTHHSWELILVDDASTSEATKRALAAFGRHDGRIRVLTLEENLGITGATNAGIAASEYEYIVFMDHDDRLARGALEWVSTCCPRADIIYTDEDKITENGDHWGAFFKPAWSPRLLLGVNYVNHLTCVRSSVLKEIGGLSAGTDGVQDHDMLLRLSETSPTVAHLPEIAYHWRAWEGSVAGNPSSKVSVEGRGLEMVQRAIDRRGWLATAALGSGAPFNYRVLFEEHTPQPTVKIIIPTRDRLKMLKQVVGGVVNRTDGVDVHIVVVDNGSEKPKTLAYLDQLDRENDNVTILRIDDAFNFSLLSNVGAVAGPETAYLLFLNNDIEIVHRRWLQQLVGWLEADPTVVGVGSKLLFPDGTIQHAGVILGFGGIAGHYAAREPNQPRLGNLHDQAREVGCLTAACLLVRTGDFDAVGGFDETLHLDFQDVDLSLRLRSKLGGELVYDPTYPMIHIESANRGGVGASSGYTGARMRFLWSDLLEAEDPYYSPHLSLNHHDFSLRDVPDDDDEARNRFNPRWSGSMTGDWVGDE